MRAIVLCAVPIVPQLERLSLHIPDKKLKAHPNGVLSVILPLATQLRSLSLRGSVSSTDTALIPRTIEHLELRAFLPDNDYIALPRRLPNLKSWSSYMAACSTEFLAAFVHCKQLESLEVSYVAVMIVDEAVDVVERLLAQLPRLTRIHLATLPCSEHDKYRWQQRYGVTVGTEERR